MEKEDTDTDKMIAIVWLLRKVLSFDFGDIDPLDDLRTEYKHAIEEGRSADHAMAGLFTASFWDHKTGRHSA